MCKKVICNFTIGSQEQEKVRQNDERHSDIQTDRHTHTDRQTFRHSDRQTDRYSDRQTDRQTRRHTDRCTLVNNVRVESEMPLRSKENFRTENSVFRSDQH